MACKPFNKFVMLLFGDDVFDLFPFKYGLRSIYHSAPIHGGFPIFRHIL